MKLIVDANILIASLIKDNYTRKIIFNSKLELYSPEFILTEIKNNEKLIIKKSHITKKELEIVLQLITSKIKLIPLKEFEDKLEEAEQTSPDPKDKIYFAIALKFENMPIWTNEKRLKKQEKIKIYNTEEITKILEN